MLWNFLWSGSSSHSSPPRPLSDRIGRVIHLVYGLWDDRSLPWRYRAMLGSWKRRHLGKQGWRVVLWSRAEAHKLVEERFPELAAIYRGYQRPVQQADLLRYLLLYEFGGFYADLDLLCLRSLESLLELASPATMVVQVETILTPARAGEIGRNQPIREGRAEIEERIANYFLGCRSRHPIMGEIIELTSQRSHLAVHNDYDVLYTTGPDVVSEVICKHRNDPDLRVLPLELAKSYASHHCWGSWRQS